MLKMIHRLFNKARCWTRECPMPEDKFETVFKIDEGNGCMVTYLETSGSCEYCGRNVFNRDEIKRERIKPL